MTKKVSIILPRCTAVWPKLNEVDVYQPVDKKGRPSGAEKRRFLTRMEFNDEDHRKVDDFLKKQLKAFDLEDGKLPWKEEKRDGKKTGKLHLEATSGADYPPPFFDAKGNEVPRSKVKIGGGSIIKVDVTVNPYTGFGGGINLYINSVQVIELKQRSTNRFEVEEGGFVFSEDHTSNDEDETSDDGASKATSHDMDDDIPF
jgi:hypothetical protein